MNSLQEKIVKTQTQTQEHFLQQILFIKFLQTKIFKRKVREFSSFILEKMHNKGGGKLSS